MGARFSLNDFSLPGTFPWGARFVPFLPKRGIPITLAIGEPVRLPKIKSPSPEDVNEYHAIYIAALQNLHSKASEAHHGYHSSPKLQCVGDPSKLEHELVARPLDVW